MRHYFIWPAEVYGTSPEGHAHSPNSPIARMCTAVHSPEDSRRINTRFFSAANVEGINIPDLLRISGAGEN